MRIRRAGTLVAVAAVLAVGAGCGSDDGADVRQLEGSGSGSGSHAGSGSGSAAGAVPTGVAAQYSQLAAEIEAEGGQTVSGPWRIGYIVEAAEPWFVKDGDGFTFREPAAGETHHIEIIPFEKSTGRVVPGASIRLEVVGGDGRVVDAKDLNFYYSSFFHYANNFSVPDAGTYTLRATIEPPQYPRHGTKEEGPALAKGAEVEFEGVQLEPPK